MVGKYLNSYTAGFAVEHGKRAAGRKFDVVEKCVRRWCNQKDALRDTSCKKRAYRGKPCKFPELEEELLCYVTEARNNGYTLTADMLRDFLWDERAPEHSTSSESEYSASKD
ncbi:hypothetical protein V5799_030319 [Amblyomma americanum]|uniref:HTH CENPB-type domain-containing protein n=1 Tax=Amblyomma americanum TaxID=6943 RepID=A0AAQ4ENH9_AMBAM